jgi:hypothetical protein
VEKLEVMAQDEDEETELRTIFVCRNRWFMLSQTEGGK